MKQSIKNIAMKYQGDEMGVDLAKKRSYSGENFGRKRVKYNSAGGGLPSEMFRREVLGSVSMVAEVSEVD